MKRKLTIKLLESIPEENWMNFLKKKYDMNCYGVDWFLIGTDAENGFLEFKSFCDKSNQTYVDVTEEEFEQILNNTYEKPMSATAREWWLDLTNMERRSYFPEWNRELTNGDIEEFYFQYRNGLMTTENLQKAIKLIEDLSDHINPRMEPELNKRIEEFLKLKF